MKRNHSKANHKQFSTMRLARLAAIGTASFGISEQTKAETLITFGGFTAQNTLISDIPNYGDNVFSDTADYTVSPGAAGIIGTPFITMDWGPGWDTYPAWDSRGSVAQTDFGRGSTITASFTPVASAAVRIASFQLDEWSGGGAGNIAWSVSGPTSGTLASGNWTMENAGGRSSITPNVSGQLGENLTLSFSLASGLGSYFALDNLAFDQVPEPSTNALLLLGSAALGALAMRRRRKG